MSDLPLLPDADEEGSIELESGVSMFDGRPFCVVRVDGRQVAQVRPDKARELGQMFFHVAEGAETDALLFHHLHTEIGLEEQAVLTMISVLRRLREDPPWTT